MRFTPQSSFAEIQAFVQAILVEKHPDYATWSALRQEAFRASRARADRAIKNAVEISALARAFDIPEDNVAKAYTSPDRDALETLIGREGGTVHNAFCLALYGVGDDWFYLNESQADGTTILSFRTIEDWDRDDYVFQTQARLEHDTDFTPTAYVGNAYASWGRAALDDRFSYLIMSTLAYHIMGDLEEHGSDFISAAVPHTWDSKPDDGKAVQGGFLWSKRVNAQGKEDLYDTLTKANQAYIQERSTALALLYAQEAKGCAWIVPRSSIYDAPWETNFDVVFSDPTAMAKVRWTAFAADMRAIAGDAAWLEAQIAAEIAQHKAMLQAIVDGHPQGGGTPTA